MFKQFKRFCIGGKISHYAKSVLFLQIKTKTKKKSGIENI